MHVRARVCTCVCILLSTLTPDDLYDWLFFCCCCCFLFCFFVFSLYIYCQQTKKRKKIHKWKISLEVIAVLQILIPSSVLFHLIIALPKLKDSFQNWSEIPEILMGVRHRCRIIYSLLNWIENWGVTFLWGPLERARVPPKHGTERVLYQLIIGSFFVGLLVCWFVCLFLFIHLFVYFKFLGNFSWKVISLFTCHLTSLCQCILQDKTCLDLKLLNVSLTFHKYISLFYIYLYSATSYASENRKSPSGRDSYWN